MRRDPAELLAAEEATAPGCLTAMLSDHIFRGSVIDRIDAGMTAADAVAQTTNDLIVIVSRSGARRRRERPLTQSRGALGERRERPVAELYRSLDQKIAADRKGSTAAVGPIRPIGR